MDLSKIIETLKDCPCGKVHTAATEVVEIGSGMTAKVGEILTKVGFPKEVLAVAEKPMTNGEITKAIGIDQPNKVCQLVAQMLTVRKGEINPNGKIVRTEEKGRAYFALAEKE